MFASAALAVDGPAGFWRACRITLCEYAGGPLLVRDAVDLQGGRKRAEHLVGRNQDRPARRRPHRGVLVDPDRFTLWQQLGLLPASPGQTADSGDLGAAGERREASPAAYAGEAALPAVTDQMLRDALQRVRPYTVCILKAAPLYQEPGPTRESWVENLIWEHGKRNYALYLASLMRIVCPIGDGSGTTGVSIFDADPDEVGRIMRQDPGVKGRPVHLPDTRHPDLCGKQPRQRFADCLRPGSN